MKSTTDLWFVIFIKQNGYEIKNYKKESKRFSWYFEISEEIWKKLKIEFPQSNVCKVKFEMEILKDLMNNN